MPQYPYDQIAPIVALFALPATGTVAFLLTPYSRRRRVAPWVLAPFVYALIALISVVVAVNLGFMDS